MLAVLVDSLLVGRSSCCGLKLVCNQSCCFWCRGVFFAWMSRSDDVKEEASRMLSMICAKTDGRSANPASCSLQLSSRVPPSSIIEQGHHHGGFPYLTR